MNIILKLNMRILSSVIIFTLLAVIGPGILLAADLDYGLFTALKSAPSFTDISPGDRLVNEPEPAKGSFLVATRRLKGPFFSEAVILLLNHSDQGSMGLVINRPSHLKLSTVFPDIKIIQKNDGTIYAGGPVELARFLALIHSDGKPPESQPLMDNLHVTSSIKTLKHMLNQSIKDGNVRVFFGYAGWGPGQLMSEVERGSWHVMNGDTELVFDKNTDGLWEKFIQRKTRESQRKRYKSESEKRKE